MNDQLLEFNGHEIFNDSNFERNGEKSIFGKKSTKSFCTKGGISWKIPINFRKMKN
jgi:hypothetical protein